MLKHDKKTLDKLNKLADTMILIDKEVTLKQYSNEAKYILRQESNQSKSTESSE